MLQDFIEVNKLKAEIIKCSHELRTAEDLSSFLKVPLGQVIKTILFIDSDNNAVLAILSGNDKINREKLCRIIKSDSIRIAEPIEVVEITGYEAGYLPPISIYGVKTIMDKKIQEKEFVVARGGDKTHLLKISPKEIGENVEEVVVGDIVE